MFFSKLSISFNESPVVGELVGLSVAPDIDGVVCHVRFVFAEPDDMP